MIRRYRSTWIPSPAHLVPARAILTLVTLTLVSVALAAVAIGLAIDWWRV